MRDGVKVEQSAATYNNNYTLLGEVNGLTVLASFNSHSTLSLRGSFPAKHVISRLHAPSQAPQYHLADSYSLRDALAFNQLVAG